MKLFAVLALALPLTILASDLLKVEQDPDAKLWEAWKHKYSKEYETGSEELARFNIWKENKAFVMKHNARFDIGLESFDVSLNVFADMSNKEFVAQRNGYKGGSTKDRVVDTTPVKTASLPSSVDWRDQGYVTPIKDQGQCGSCWSFSTTGTLEGQHKNATGTLISLSEQQLVDCDYNDLGCLGGLPSTALNYLERVGSDLESDYPYTSGTSQHRGHCQAASFSPAATVSGYTDLPYGNEGSLQEATANVGPISVAIDASHLSFQLYSSGVYYEPSCSSSSLDHAVLVIGYGNYQGSDYWLVKNSWGTGWGLDGYIMMSRNRNNNCGIASQALYPIV